MVANWRLCHRLRVLALSSVQISLSDSNSFMMMLIRPIVISIILNYG
jgi:hypothetical protein